MGGLALLTLCGGLAVAQLVTEQASSPITINGSQNTLAASRPAIAYGFFPDGLFQINSLWVLPTVCCEKARPIRWWGITTWHEAD